MDNCYMRSTRRPGIDNWERQSEASLHGGSAADWPKLARAQRLVADLQPGDCLYIPSQWLHEVHSRTASFSLGWRVAMRTSTGARVERTVDQKIERMSSAFKNGTMVTMQRRISQQMPCTLLRTRDTCRAVCHACRTGPGLSAEH